ncbi:transposase domain-containing protein [Clostridium butyricum]|uniref:transposase domain-containing protein n=1 Tax=Clostridium butyricum TaxID=1492 RepID=UPI003D111BA0
MEDKNFDELDDKTKVIISKMEKVIKDKDSEIKTKTAEIEDLKNQLAFLKGQILNKNRKIFGQSSEQANEDQLSFFNEAKSFKKQLCTCR